MLNHRAGRLALQPAREHVPPGRARSHLELEVARAVDELEHRVRRIVPLPVAELVDARVPAWPRGVARSERLEDFGREGGLQQESRGLLKGGVRALLTERDDLAALGSETTTTATAKEGCLAFSARRAVSRAFGSVVFTCSCCMRDETRLLKCSSSSCQGDGSAREERLSGLTVALASGARTFLRTCGKRRHASWRCSGERIEYNFRVRGGSRCVRTVEGAVRLTHKLTVLFPL